MTVPPRRGYLLGRRTPRAAGLLSVLPLLGVLLGAGQGVRAQLWTLKAERLQSTFDYDGALAARQTAARLRPTDARLQLALARDARSLWFFREDPGLQRTADAAFARAARLSPHWARPHYEHARMYSFKGQPARALALLEPALRLDPNNPGYWLERGRLLETLQAPQAALKAYRRCWALDAVSECDSSSRRLGGAG